MLLPATKTHLGMFAFACFGCDELVKKVEETHDNVAKIMAQAQEIVSLKLLPNVCITSIHVEVGGYMRLKNIRSGRSHSLIVPKRLPCVGANESKEAGWRWNGARV